MKPERATPNISYHDLHSCGLMSCIAVKMKPRLLILSSISSVIFITLLSPIPFHHKSFIRNSSGTTVLDSNSNSSFHGVECLPNSFFGLITGFSKQQSSDHDVNIKLETELPWPIIEYPSDYGAEKYLQRKATATANRSCNLYSKFSASDVVRKIQKEVLNDKSALKFMKGHEKPYSESMPVTFGGNLDVKERKRYFNYSEGMELPCGFLNHHSTGFVLSEEDREAMELCRGLVVISAIFGAYDRIRQPKHVRRITAESVCFFMFMDNVTLTGLARYQIKPDESHRIGLWRIVLVRELPYKESVMNGLIPKHLPHRLFPNSVYSIWTDAKLQLVVDPLLTLKNLLISHNAEIAMSKHPYNTHTIEEASFTVRWGKWSKEAVRYQMEHYCADGLQPWSSEKFPYSSDVPDTALILRKHNWQTNLFSCLLFNELQVFNPRDQLAFAYVRDMMRAKVGIHMFDVNIFNTITNEYRHSHKINGSIFKEPALNQQISLGYDITACKSYLDRMWNDKYF